MAEWLHAKGFHVHADHNQHASSCCHCALALKMLIFAVAAAGTMMRGGLDMATLSAVLHHQSADCLHLNAMLGR